MVDTAKTLLQGKQAAGQSVFPADELLAEAERLSADGAFDEAGLLAASALNVLGMTDDAIAKLQCQTKS